MQVTLRNSESETQVTLRLSDERRALANFLSIVNTSVIDELEISDLTESKLPKNIQKLTKLKVLRLVRCHALASLPENLDGCPMLKELAIIKCADFHDLRGISELKNLRVLHVSGCECFEDIPDELAQMENLKAIDFSYSDGIRWISVRDLPQNLRLLDMHGCWQSDFSDSEASDLKLVSLQIQDLSRFSDLDAEPLISNICVQLRHTMTLRDGCGLDA